LYLKLNRTINKKWEELFYLRFTLFSANFSSAAVTFRGDMVYIQSPQYRIQEKINWVKEYIGQANEDYAAKIQQEHRDELQRQRAALKSKAEQEETRLKLLREIEI
jgi:LPS O-antigen subunit length determinant protein (WzzB/FepE family)